MQQQQKERNYLNKTFTKVIEDGSSPDKPYIMISLALDKGELMDISEDSYGKIRLVVAQKRNASKHNDCSIWEDQYEPKQQRQQQDEPQIDPDDLPY